MRTVPMRIDLLAAYILLSILVGWVAGRMAPIGVEWRVWVRGRLAKRFAARAARRLA